MWVWTKVLMLVWQVLWILNYLLPDIYCVWEQLAACSSHSRYSVIIISQSVPLSMILPFSLRGAKDLGTSVEHLISIVVTIYLQVLILRNWFFHIPIHIFFPRLSQLRFLCRSWILLCINYMYFKILILIYWSRFDLIFFEIQSLIFLIFVKWFRRTKPDLP